MVMISVMFWFYFSEIDIAEYLVVTFFQDNLVVGSNPSQVLRLILVLLAQLVERLVEAQEVVSSNLTEDTKGP